MSDFRECVREVAVRYLKAMNYEIIDANYAGFIIAERYYEIVFAQLEAACHDTSVFDSKFDREKFEAAVCIGLIEHPELLNMRVRGDLICINVVSEKAADVKHYVNISSEE